MYEIISNDIRTEYYQQEYANDGQRFVAWYLRNIHNLEPFEAKDCITDGADDKQIDAIYIDNQASTVYIIQGKFYSGEIVDAEPLREVISSWIQIKDLQHLQEAANEKLKVKIPELSTALDDGYEVCFELIITAGLTPAAHADLETFKNELAESANLEANLVLVDNEALKFKYEEALNTNRPYINHVFQIEPNKYMELSIGGTRAIIAAIPLKECVRIPGIKDGSLFRKNVRQSLGTGNKVNKAIAHTIREDADNFFFLHNGITAICSEITIDGNRLNIKELNVVNGCQSLNTIYSCSECVKNGGNAYIMFRFYEIKDPERADKISISTNSQSAVKARDLRSNDKSVLAMKKAYEQYYADGCFITKRGEKPKPGCNQQHIVNLTDIGKQLMAWHSQRPTISYSETKIFDKYFDQLFHKDYAPQNIQALHDLYGFAVAKWNSSNPLDFNEALLAMKAYAPYHHLFTISVIICGINHMPAESVPNPSEVYSRLRNNDLLDDVVGMAGHFLNSAFESASEETRSSGKIFSPQNWIKAKGSLKDIRTAARNGFTALKAFPEGRQLLQTLSDNLKMGQELFESRWTAD